MSVKILCLTPRLDRPSTKYRILQYQPYLNSAGIETSMCVIPKGAKILEVLHSANKYSGIFIQKKLLSRVEQWYLKKRAKRIIYDFDDAIMYTKKNHSEDSRRYKRFNCMMSNADVVIAGNKYLADIACADHSGRVVVIPTVIDISKYPLHARNDYSVTVGWIGTRSTQGYLKITEPVFDRLVNKYPLVKIKIVSDKKPEFCNNNKIIWERWDQDKEIEQLLSFDIGIMPLIEDPWTKGKCGFKIIQYMAVGVPTVCSAVGANKEIVTNEVNGLYANSVEDWEKNISRLIEDKELYKKLAVAGRKTVEEKYNLAYWGAYLANVLKERLC